jgi:O-methyltransferase involved in polyketide biosynthesis
MNETQESDFNKISQTAFMTTLARRFTDIPFTKELADLVSAQRVTYLPVILEARYKAINKISLEYGITQILEFASGFLPRGLEFSAAPEITFVESDLPDIIGQKRQIVENLGISRANLHFADIDAVARPNQFLDRTENIFKPDQPVLVSCEGLLLFLTKNEKRNVCLNVRELLERHGGVWLTPDFTSTIGMSPSKINDTGFNQTLDSLKVLVNKTLTVNAFETSEEAREFLKDLGFTVKENQLINVLDELSCVDKLNLNPELVKRQLANRSIFIISV